MRTSAPVAPPAGGCPEPEQLAAYIDGALGPDERTLVQQHLVGCAECREVVAESVAVVDEMGGRVVPLPQPLLRPRTKLWVGMGAVLAAAAAVIIAVRMQRPSPYYVPEIAQLVAVNAVTRPVEPRLTQGFSYAPPAPVTRGTTETRNLELTATAEQVRRDVGDRAGAEADAARGVTSLVIGDAEKAVASLEAATKSPSATARMFSDLAAAYLQRGRPDDPTRALDAAQHAIALDPSIREAAFNRALALEHLGRIAEALQAWRDYADHEPDRGWADEARRHIARLSGS